MKTFFQAAPIALLTALPAVAYGAVGGSISGLVQDASGAVIPHASVRATETSRGATYIVTANNEGVYVFPNLPVGTYDLSASAASFAPQRVPHIVLDTDAALRLDLTLTINTRSDSVEVVAQTTRVETAATHLGEVVSASQMTGIPLNGRGYTDLLAIQSGVAPATTLLPDSVIMAGVTGAISPSGDGNPGNLSINGQRESSNGFLVNGIDVQEHMNGGTSIIPDLDSIQEFRVLTTSFDSEYGNYNGGIVSVITKSGSNRFHGEAFEFFRNTNLDARGYFDPTRSAFNQNQYGGAFGGPGVRDKLFFFTDYQGTRMAQGVSTGNISVPTNAERTGGFHDAAGNSTLTGTVSGPYLASLLSSSLRRPVQAGQAYRDVFPGGVIPQSAWSAPARNLLQYIPAPNVGTDQFATAAFSKTVRDDKASGRLDWQSRFGGTSLYYFADDYRVSDPYPGQQGGASIPGFAAITSGRAQLLSLGNTRVIGSRAVNEFHLGILRNANIIGQPDGGNGVSLASQGFTTGAGTPGIVVQAPQFEGVENIVFPTFTMGVPITNETQINNTLFLSDGITYVAGSHSLKFGGQFHADQVNEHPNATFNGTFNINGTETGSPYADFLLGVASNFTQSSGQPFYLRDRYFGSYAQDSWRARSDLTLNAGIRWDVIMPWWEKTNQLQTYVAGRRSTLYPGAPVGLLVAGDPGVPRTIAPVDYGSFAPRIGLAYAPRSSRGFWKALLGEGSNSSIRASFGIFYSAYPGLATGIMYAVPPFGYNYLSPAPPLLQTPFITAATGVNNGQRFPFAFPPKDVSASKPDTAVDWSNFVPISADPYFDQKNRPAYISNYMLSLQRQITNAAVLTVSYVGSQGHRLLALASANPGDPALCLALPGCGPFGEDSAYTDKNGNIVQGTRTKQGPDYGNNTSDSSIANSSYNALQSSLRVARGSAYALLSYTYARSLDQASNLGEQINPLNPSATRAISAWDMRHSFVATYAIPLPFASLLHASRGVLNGWQLSGTTRFASGFPVTLSDSSDNSLLGTLGNGVNNLLLDTPQFAGGDLAINRDGRNGRSAFKTALFQPEALGQLGNSKRRFFYGPGINNFDIALEKTINLGDQCSIALRAEAFNAFNHAQFYGPAAVEGQIQNPNFGRVVSAAPPRLMQLAARLSF